MKSEVLLEDEKGNKIIAKIIGIQCPNCYSILIDHWGIYDHYCKKCKMGFIELEYGKEE